MHNNKHIQIRVEEKLLQIIELELRETLHTIFAQQHFQARLSAHYVEHLCHKFERSPAQLAQQLLPIATAFSRSDISHFKVGTAVIGQSGSIYLGANQEFTGCAIQQTIHAEQSAITHAWLEGESSLIDLFVNYTPCGHCRQFMQELNCSDTLRIHLSDEKYKTLNDYLPDSFSPHNLGLKNRLFDTQQHNLSSIDSDALVQAATAAANMSYAPYSHCYSGVALETIDHKIFIGSYAENVAFNPSLPPMQAALNLLILSGYEYEHIQRAVLVEVEGDIRQHEVSHAVLRSVNDQCEFLCFNLS